MNNHETAANIHALDHSTKSSAFSTARVASLRSIAIQATFSDSTEMPLKPLEWQDLPEALAQLPATSESRTPKGAFIDVVYNKSTENSQSESFTKPLQPAIVGSQKATPATPPKAVTPHRVSAHKGLVQQITPPDSSQKSVSIAPLQSPFIESQQDELSASDRLILTPQANTNESSRNIHQPLDAPADCTGRDHSHLPRARADQFHKKSPTPLRKHNQITHGLEAATTRLSERLQGELSRDKGENPLKRKALWELSDPRPLEKSLGAAFSPYQAHHDLNRQYEQSQYPISKGGLDLSPEETQRGRDRYEAASERLLKYSDEEKEVARSLVALPQSVDATATLLEIKQEDQRLLAVKTFFEESKEEHHCQHHYCITDILSPDPTSGNFAGCPTDCGNFNKEATIPDEEQYQAWHIMTDGNAPNMGEMPDPGTREQIPGREGRARGGRGRGRPRGRGRGRGGKIIKDQYQGPPEYLMDPSRQDIYAYANNWEVDPASGERRWIGSMALPTNPFLKGNRPSADAAGPTKRDSAVGMMDLPMTQNNEGQPDNCLEDSHDDEHEGRHWEPTPQERLDAAAERDFHERLRKKKEKDHKAWRDGRIAAHKKGIRQPGDAYMTYDEYEDWQRENREILEGAAEDKIPKTPRTRNKRTRIHSQEEGAVLTEKLETINETLARKAGHQKLRRDATKSLEDLDEEADRLTAEAVQVSLRRDVDFDAIRREALKERSEAQYTKLIDSLKAKLSLSKRTIENIEQAIIRDITVLVNRESKRGTRATPEMRDFTTERAVKLMQSAVWESYRTGRVVEPEYFQIPLELDGFLCTRDLVRGLLSLQRRLCAVPQPLESAVTVTEGGVIGEGKSMKRTEKITAVEKNAKVKRPRQISNEVERSKRSCLATSSEVKQIVSLQSELGERWQMPIGERKRRSPGGSGGSGGSNAS